MVEIKAPQFPESIADGEVAMWHVALGEAVRRDQVSSPGFELFLPRAGVVTAWEALDPDVRDQTIVFLTVSDGDDAFLY